MESVHIKTEPLDGEADLDSCLDNPDSGYYGYSGPGNSDGRFQYDPSHSDSQYDPPRELSCQVKQELESDDGGPERLNSSHLTSDMCNPHNDRPLQTDIKEEGNPAEAFYDGYSSPNIPNGTGFAKPVSNYLASSFMCLWPTCQRMFATNEELLQHVVLHEKATSRECHTCEKVFVNKKSLKKHMEMHENGYGFFCDKRKCEEGFLTEHELLMHSEAHKMPSCSVCGKSFTSTSHLKQHMSTHSAEQIPCPKAGCTKTFKKNSSLVLHLRSHEQDGQDHICPTCGREFASQRKLKQHLRSTHASNTRFMCPVDDCNRGFKVKDSLRKHLISHSDEKSQKCEACGNTFKFDHTLRNHRRTNTMLDKYVCDIQGCSAVFLMGCALRQHRASEHNLSSDIPCSSCGVVLPSKKALFAHRRDNHHREPGVKTVKCGYKNCDAMFTSVTTRNKHMRTIHTERKPKVVSQPPTSVIFCEGCGTTFKSQESLTNHVADQVTRSAYVCNIGVCRRSFSMKCIYQRHRLLFHSKNPSLDPSQSPSSFVCPHEGCAKAFKEAKCCKAHMSAAHRPGYADCVLKCPTEYCEKTFKFKYDLEEHVHNHQKGKSSESDTQPNNNLNQHSVGNENPADVPNSENPESSIIHEEEEPPAVEKPMVCPVCGKNFNKLKSIRRHLECMHYLKTSLVCTFEGCNQSFKSVFLFKEHRKNKCPSVKAREETGGDLPLARVSSYECEQLTQKADAESETFLCPDCGKSFTSKSSFHRHKRVKHRSMGQTYVCDVEGCGKVFDVREYYTKHKRSHTMEREVVRLRCEHPGCDKHYGSPHSLRRHMRRHTQTQPKSKHKCPVESCNASFVWKCALNEHLAMHAGAFDCSVCNKRINSKYSLKIHMARHSNEAKLPCPEEGCRKKFHHEKELQRHMKYHIGNKRHVCPVPGCKARFYYPGQIPAHVAAHRSGKVYHCPHKGCDAVMLSVADSNRHRLTHHGRIKKPELKKFPCTQPDCTREFHSKYSRNRHLKNIHFIGSDLQHYRCPVENCQVAYADLTECLVHIGTKHPDAQVEPIQGGSAEQGCDDSEEESLEAEVDSFMDVHDLPSDSSCSDSPPDVSIKQETSLQNDTTNCNGEPAECGTGWDPSSGGGELGPDTVECGLDGIPEESVKEECLEAKSEADDPMESSQPLSFQADPYICSVASPLGIENEKVDSLESNTG